MITELSVGDRVICTRTHDGNERAVNQLGTIVRHLKYKVDGGLFTVEFDEDIKGHDGEWWDGYGRCYQKFKQGHCWNFPSEKLSKITPQDVDDLEDDF